MASLVANLNQPIDMVENMTLDRLVWWIETINDLRKSEQRN